MKKRSKKLLASMVVCGLLSAPIQAIAESVPVGFQKAVLPITIHADGAYVKTDVAPAVKNKRILLPLRAAGEAINATVEWNQQAQTATAQKDGTTVIFKLNSTTYYVNGVAKLSDTAPAIINNRILLPIRVFSEALNARVNWNNTIRDVSIDTDADDINVNIPPDSSPEAKMLIKKYYVAPDANDPLVGSWKHLGLTEGENLPMYTYHFISKNADGTYNDIWAEVSDHPLTHVSTMKDVLVRVNTISGNRGNLTGTNPNDSVIYSQGRNRDYEQPQFYFYKLDEHDMLVATGYYLSVYGTSNIVDYYNIYMKY